MNAAEREQVLKDGGGKIIRHVTAEKDGGGEILVQVTADGKAAAESHVRKVIEQWRAEENRLCAMPIMEIAVDLPLPDGGTFPYFRGHGDYVDTWNRVVSPIGNALIQVIRYQDEETRRMVAAEECKRIPPDYRERGAELLAHWVDRKAWENPTRNYADDYTFATHRVVEENHVIRIIASVTWLSEDDPLRTAKGVAVCPIKLRNKPAVPKAPKGQPPFDANGLGRMPTDHYVAEHLGAQMLARDWPNTQGGWERNPQGPPSIHKDHPNGGRIHITLGGPEFNPAEQAADMIQAAVKTTMEQYGALSVDVTLSLLAILGDPRQVSYPLIQPVYLSTKTILKNKAFERYGKDGRLMEQQIAEIVNALPKLRVYFHGVWVDTRSPITIEDGKLFDIEKSYKEQRNIDGTWTLIECGWVMRLGMWANIFLNPKERIWLSDVARDVLELDHRDNRQAAQMAKFIWIRFLGCMAGRVNEKGPVRVRVGELLKAIGFLPVEAERSKDWYRRTRENLERAFGKLLNLGAVARWDYSEDCPNIEDKIPWNEAKWLDAYVTLVDPASLPESERRQLLPKPDLEDHPINRAFLRAARIDEARARKGKPKPEKPRRERLAPAKQTPLANAQERLKLPETRAALKKKRLSLGLHQTELARQLGISRQTYGNIERGEFAPGDRTGTAEKLLVWLDSPEGD